MANLRSLKSDDFTKGAILRGLNIGDCKESQK